MARAIRMHQWLKNLLIFVPVLAGQRFGDPGVVVQAVLAFVAFSLVASSVYVLNDVLDLQHDRRHPTKRRRPFASGHLSVSWAGPMTIVLIGLGILASLWLPGRFQIALGVYLLLTFAYSLRLKGTVLIDVLTLAGLYTLRVVAGSMATGIDPSVWLLGFSLFFFFSLALVKRYAELHRGIADGSASLEEGLPGRGYQLRDLPVLIGLGVGSGCMAVLVLALYVIGDEFAQHYTRPILLWQLCPLALYWIGRAWIVVARNEMTDDPVVWAFRDEMSRWVGLVALILLLLAR
jgi:4-hydroxybenzoate polyprenyltransferase